APGRATVGDAAGVAGEDPAGHRIAPRAAVRAEVALLRRDHQPVSAERPAHRRRAAAQPSGLNLAARRAPRARRIAPLPGAHLPLAAEQHAARVAAGEARQNAALEGIAPRAAVRTEVALLAADHLPVATDRGAARVAAVVLGAAPSLLDLTTRRAAV